MKSISHRLAFLAFILALFGVPPARALPSEQPSVSLRFLFLDETAGAYSWKNGAAYRQISAGPYAISQPLIVAPGDRLEIYKTLAALDPSTGKPRRVKIATVAPPSSTSALVVISPRPSAPGSAEPPSYGVSFFDNDPKAFPGKSIRILNLGQASMAAMFGTDQVVTPPGSSRIVQPATDQRNRVLSKVAAQTASGWNLLYDSITILRPNERVTGVFVYSPSGLRYTYTPEEIAERGPPPPGHFWLTYSDLL